MKRGFRVWNHFAKKMFIYGGIKDVNYLLAMNGNLIENYDYWFLVDKENVIRMDSTGLTDKHGKEIFEGDIITTRDINNYDEKDNRIGEIRWDEMMPSIVCISLPQNGERFYLNLNDMQIMEIIGNIYENPELLKASK